MELHVDDYLHEASVEALRGEVRSRIALKEWRWEVPSDPRSDVEPWAPASLAADLRTAFYARNANRFEALLLVLERESVSA